jgi:hypothetical protein
VKALLNRLLKSLLRKAVHELLDELKKKTGVDVCEPDGE